MQTSVRSRLRARLNGGPVSVWAGAHDAMSARLVEEAGFDGVWASSFGISLASRCVPDLDLVTVTETLDIARNMVGAVDIPVIADCNAGFGNAINVQLMTRDFERAGVAGICIEDNAFPKCCSLYERGHRELASRDEMAGKIRAAVSVRKDPDFAIIARVESLIAGRGVDSALRRAQAYAAAGADAIVVHAKAFDRLQEFLQVWDGRCPLVAIPTLYNQVSVAELERHGYRVVIFPNQAIRAAVQAMRQTLQHLRETGVGASVDDRTVPLGDINRLVRLQDVEAAEAAFLPVEDPRRPAAPAAPAAGPAAQPPAAPNGIHRLFDQGLVTAREKWSLLPGDKRSLDLVNHVLRVILQLDRLDAFVPEFEALLACQHAVGAWGDHSTSRRPGVRNTCFAARNLVRANRRLQREDFAAGIEAAVRYVMSMQSPEGFFPDPVWGPRDATSSSMGLLHYARQESFGAATEEIHAEAAERLSRAAAHLERSQERDGSWHDTKAYEAPVGPTAHLLPKMVLFAKAPTPPVQAAVDYLVGSQGADGSWDNRHVDHTCDATRALLLAYSVLRDARLPRVIEGGVNWLRANPAADGLWGVRPGRQSNLIMTCDVLDCFSKYEAHQRELDLRLFWQ